MTNVVTYLLSAELKNGGMDFTDISRFEYVLQVSKVKNGYEDVTFWEALSGKYHSEDWASGLTRFKVDIANVVLNLCPRLYKATDFTRRLNYAYDSIELMTDDKGQIQKVRNVEELNENWKIIREMLQADYKGSVVDAYLDKIDKEISCWSFLYSSWNYLLYGLLFPGIPGRQTDWAREREIIVSRYDEEPMCECLSYRESIDGNRKYDITGKLQEESKLVLEQFEGTLFVKEKEILPNYATVNIRYRNGSVLNSWSFKLDKY